MEKTALITGASSGLGLEFAKIFAKEGYNLVLVSRNKDKLSVIKNDLETSYKIEIEIFAKDLSQKDATIDIFNFTVSNNIVLDVLVNNAGFGDFGAYADCDWQKQYEMVQLNIIALIQLTHCFLSSMIKRKNGMILNIASVAAFQSGPLMSVYYASKSFVLSFTEALSVELKNTGVYVTALCPGPTKTNFEKNASLSKSGLFKHLKNTTAKDVAKYGYHMLTNHKTIAIYGITNKFIPLASRLLPRKIIKNFVYKIQK